MINAASVEDQRTGNAQPQILLCSQWSMHAKMGVPWRVPDPALWRYEEHLPLAAAPL